jgi:hypothetical protein
MLLLLTILERLCKCYWPYWREYASVTDRTGDSMPYRTECASVTGHTAESTHLLQAILVRVHISYRPYWRECASVTGHTAESTHLLQAIVEGVCMC